MDPLITEIRNELSDMSDEKTKDGFQRFFKEPVKYYGVKTATVGKIAKKYWNIIKNREKKEIFRLCEELFQSGYCEEAFIVSNWAAEMSDRYEPVDIYLFKRWIGTYITNWAECDGFCNHTVGDFVQKYPFLLEEIVSWTGSSNRWMRRASAVSLIIPAKRGMFLDEIFSIADRLLTDSDDMVQKGYGWLLKEASTNHRSEVFSYVMKNKKVMPRTALRYAIERMDPELRKEAMKKDWK
jgi:3-methyladenine DNA glycosylase AlkD